VLAEETREVALGHPGAAEHQQPGGLPVEPVHHEERGVRGGELPLRQHRGHPVDQRAALAHLEGDAVHPRGLVDDHDLRVAVDEPPALQEESIRRGGVRRAGAQVQLHHHARAWTRRGVALDGAVEGDLASGAPLLGGRPGNVPPPAENGAEGLASVAGVKHESVGVHGRYGWATRKAETPRREV
jgi:hypothetical protein